MRRHTIGRRGSACSVIQFGMKKVCNTLVLAIDGRDREGWHPVCQDGSVPTLEEHAQLPPPLGNHFAALGVE